MFNLMGLKCLNVFYNPFAYLREREREFINMIIDLDIKNNYQLFFCD